MSLLDTLIHNERALTRGDGDACRRPLTGDTVVIVAVMVLDTQGTAAAIDLSNGRDAVDTAEAQLRCPVDDVALVTCGVTGHRGSQTYPAQMSSAYAQRDGQRWLAPAPTAAARGPSLIRTRLEPPRDRPEVRTVARA